MALEEFAPIGVLFFFSGAITLLILVLSRLFGPFKPTARKVSPYESGMRPIGQGTRRIPVKFYLIAVLFIIFDVEVVFLFPWAVVFRDLGVFGLIVMGVFVVVLTVGFLYEWKKGALEWE